MPLVVFLFLVLMVRDRHCFVLRHVFSGSADDTLQTLKEILEDIDSVQEQIGEKPSSNKILMKIKNTMSDRYAAESIQYDP